ncbi:Chitin deacetylase [Penicillium rolfsii]|nr:Chitin deacetylase [Penicillium rolfsii]
MRYTLSLAAPALALTLILPTVTSLVFGPYEQRPYEQQHWFETRQSKSQDPSPVRSVPSLVIDTFQNSLHNDLGFWHGTGENLTLQHEPGSMRLFPTDPDQNFHTQFNIHDCFSLLPWQDQFLHVAFEGNEEFTVSLNEHNEQCNPARAPFPGVPDSVQASRYIMKTVSGDPNDQDEDLDESFKHGNQNQPLKHRFGNDTRGGDRQLPAWAKRFELFIPLSHFRVNQKRVVSVSFTGFYTREPITLYRVEIVPDVPSPAAWNGYFSIPEKLPTGQLILRCSRPNSFAFGIDDGQPQYAQEVMRILDEEDVRVTFFAVATGLRDGSTNFTRFYSEMLKKGHQVALHSNTHPKMEALPTLHEINDEIIQSIRTLDDQLGVRSRYFRPPYGTVGVRLRQQLAQYINDPYIVNWSVDVEDWLWGDTNTPERQLDAFYRAVARGGNLAVMHYLSPITTGYLRHFIRHVKSLGLNIMRVDQCLEDPNSPPL